MTAPAYLDYQATTPVAPEVATAMRPWIEEKFANPHSSHKLGREAAAAVEVARERVIDALQGFERAPGKLYFTAGATEAANWALKGAAARLPEGRRRIVTVATEHACVLDTAEWLGSQGYEIEFLPVGRDGLVDLNLAAERIDPRTGLVAVMLVNNEIGAIQPVAELSALAHARHALLFCDAVQGFGRVELPLAACDMLALSGHKYLAKNGALWRATASPSICFMAGREAASVPYLSPACVSASASGAPARRAAQADHEHVESCGRSTPPMADWTLNGPETVRYHGNLNIRRDGVDSARLISEVRDVAFSSGSACASGSGRPSHVLAALGLSEREARSSLRFGFGRYTTEKELVSALGLVRDAAVRQLNFAA